MSSPEKEKIKVSIPRVIIFIVFVVMFLQPIYHYSVLFAESNFVRKIFNNNKNWIALFTLTVIPLMTVLIVAIFETIMNLVQLIASTIFKTTPLKKITDYTHTKNYFIALMYSYKKVIKFVVIVAILTAIYGLANSVKEQIEESKRREESEKELGV